MLFVTGVFIDVMLQNWRGKYDVLESRHDYIQWYAMTRVTHISSYSATCS